jgi:hypothetical protein
MKLNGAKQLRIRPCELRLANEIIGKWHRHHKPVVGHRFSLKVVDEDEGVCGIAVCGRPVARLTCSGTVLEITRLATDGTPNACSMLYGACRKVAKAMGFEKIQTFILETEPGVSLRAAGYQLESVSPGGNWSCTSRPDRRQDQPMCPKQKWVCNLTDQRIVEQLAEAIPAIAA